MMPKKPRLNAYHEHVAQSLKKKKMKNAIKTKTNNFDFTSDESSSDESDKFMAINSVGSSVVSINMAYFYVTYLLTLLTQAPQFIDLCCSKCKKDQARQSIKRLLNFNSIVLFVWNIFELQ